MTPPNAYTKSKPFGFEIWPITNLIGMLMIPRATTETAKEHKPKYQVKPLHTSLHDLIQNFPLRMIPFWGFAMLCDYFYPVEQMMQESNVAINKFLAGDKDLSHHGWLLKLTVRDLIASLLCSFIWWWLVSRPDMRVRKFNADYTHAKHYTREIMYSVSTILMGTLFEAGIMGLYATGYNTKYFLNMRENMFAYWWLIIVMPVYRDGHFWWVHRAMHHWDTKYIPDVGKWLYNVAHSLHHQSRNIQPWSGISMHPIEGFLYESATLIPIMFTHHPIVINVCKIDLNYAAILGHDGYEYPGHGDWFHTVHHMKIRGNYGSANAPFDWLFGTVDYGDDLDHVKVDKHGNYVKELEKQEGGSAEKKEN